MKMNRRMLNVLGVFAFFFMLLLVFPGFADGGIINPYQSQVWELEKLQSRLLFRRQKADWSQTDGQPL